MRFPEFTGEWQLLRLGEIGKTYNGLTGKSGEDFGEGYPYITYKSIFDSSKIDISRVEYVNITEEELKKGGQNEVQYGDIFFTTSSETPEEVGMASVLLDKINHCYLNSFCFGYRLNQTNIHLPEFMRFYLRSQSIRRKLFILAQGSTRFNISKNEVMRMGIMLPHTTEQRKIAQLLTLIDEHIATQSKIIDKLQSLMCGICERLLYFDTGENVKLGDILPERIEKTTQNNQYEILSSTVKGIFLQREYFSKDIASENNIGYKIVRLNDVVLSPQNLWMGNINFNDKFQIGAVSPSYKIFTIAERFYKPFIAAVLKTRRALYNYELVSEQGASIVRRNLNMEAFEQLTFKIPSYNKQVQIGNAISALQRRIDLTQKLYWAMTQQKQWLLQQMFI